MSCYNTEYNKKKHKINNTKQNVELTNNVHKIQKTHRTVS